MHEEPQELASDLEWMLLSQQVPGADLASLLVDEHFEALYRMAFALLGDARQAQVAVIETLSTALATSHTYQSDTSVRHWLLAIGITVCRARENPRTAREMPAPGFSPDAGVVKERNPITDFHGLRTLPWDQHLALVLRFDQGLTPPEIGQLLKKSSTQVESLLEVAGSHLQGSGDDVVRLLAGDRRLHSLSSTARPAVVQRVLEGADTQRRRARRRSSVAEVGLALVAILLVVVGMTLINGRIQLPQPTPVPTVLVTRLITVIVTATPPPVQDLAEAGEPAGVLPSSRPLQESASLQPLTSESSLEEVSTRMQEAYTRWRDLWVEARVTFGFPPVDEAEVRREQLWISQPFQNLVLSGPQQGEPDHTWVAIDQQVYELDEETGKLLFYDYQPGHLSLFAAARDLVFPELLLRRGALLEVGGVEQVAGRDALKVTWMADNGLSVAHLWVDTRTGLVLQLDLVADENAGEKTRQVTITRLAYNPVLRDVFGRGRSLMDVVRGFGTNLPTWSDYNPSISNSPPA